MNNFSKTVDLLHRALDAQTIRRDVLANNLANAEVPNFKRSELNFESELKRALDSEKQRPVIELARSDPRHISNWNPLDWREVKPRRVLDYVSTSKNNGNNVDAEQEVQRLVENQLMYYLLSQATAFEFSQVTSVLRN
ncbi:MAG: flagellar basal body rod protein FlgB [Spirochaetaceae bacterium]|jgi:flagellar basal-body rod protein FlgB|nr:flagellar basal body rod protein FlgB [Spirochaetaceae bacterium]